MIEVLDMIKDLELAKADPSVLDSMIEQYRKRAELIEAEMNAQALQDRWDFEQFGKIKVDSIHK